MKNIKKLTLVRFITNLIKSYRFYLGLFGFVGLLWAIINTLLPYTLKIIIDKIVAFQGDKIDSFPMIQWDILVYVLAPLQIISKALNHKFWTHLKCINQIAH